MATQWLLPLLVSPALPASGSGEENLNLPGSGVPRGEIFSEVAGELGLDFVYTNGMSGAYYFCEMMGGGGAFFDYDNDADLDVYLVQGQMLGQRERPDLRDRLYRNDLVVDSEGRRILRFTDVTEQSEINSTGYGMGVATGDFDNDGWMDLYVANFGSNQMLRNNGDGTFNDVTEEAGSDDRRWTVSAIFLDFDRDGWLDLYLVNYVDFALATHKACRSNTGARDYCGPHAYNPVPDRLFRNTGSGTFEVVTRRSGLGAEFGSGLGVITGDFDADGWIDLYVANDGLPNQMWMNQGDGTFQNEALMAGAAVNAEGMPEAGMGVDAGDFDGDGDEELILTHLTRETNTLYASDGIGGFEDSTISSGLASPSWQYTGFGVAALDYDNDGWLDLVVANGAVKHIWSLVQKNDPYPLHQTNQLFHNRGDGRFEEVTQRAGQALSVSEVSRGVAVGDVDNDGDTDVLIINNNGPVRLLRNNVGHERHWLGLRVVSAAARDAFDAWVRVESTGRSTLWRRARTGGSYASASDPRVLVGLGKSSEVGEVQILWPSGRREAWRIEQSDHYVTLREGSGNRIP